MRVFTFISKDGDSLPIAQRIVDEGHRAIFYINSDKRRVGDGLIEKSTVQPELVDIEKGVFDKSLVGDILHPRPDCIVMDMVGWGFGKLADYLRKKGYPTIGGSQWGDQVELDRPYGTKVMKMMGISVPKTYTFNDYPQAIRFVEDTNKPYVYKPSGNQPTMTTYVSEGPDDLIGILEHYSDINEEFELQEKVDGIEISTEVWYNGKSVISVNHTMEEKTLMADGIGPKTGSMGSTVWIGRQGSRLYKEGIGKAITALRRVDYRGPIDLNTIVSEKGLKALEFTPRFGYDAIFALSELYKGRLNDLMYGMATGVLNRMDFRKGWGMGVVLAVQPYPLPKEEDFSKGLLLQGFTSQNLKHTWFYDVYKKDGKYACSGNGGNIGAITAGGESVRECKRRIYRTISNIIIPNMMYRKDIGDRVDREVNQLKQWGWL